MKATDITQILAKIHDGQPEASGELFSRVHKELRRLAATLMRLERPGHSWQPTELVHELYLRLGNRIGPSLDNRAHFFGAAAHLMREILVDHARSKLAKKRGGDVVKISVDDLHVVTAQSASELLGLDEALRRLTTIAPRQSQIVELRFFGGLSIEEIAKIFDLSPRTVDRDWRAARAWLRREVTPNISA